MPLTDRERLDKLLKAIRFWQHEQTDWATRKLLKTTADVERELEKENKCQSSRSS